MSGRTTTVISHDLVPVREASEIVVLENGRVAERGSLTDLLEKEGVYARLYEMRHAAAQKVEP